MSSLLAEPALIIEPKLGWKDVADYAVLRPSGELLGAVREDTTGVSRVARVIFRTGYGPSRVLHVTDLSGVPLLHVSKGRGRLWPTVTVSSDVHEPLGTLEVENWSGRDGTLYDANRAETGIVHRPWGGINVIIADANGAQLAHITMRPPEAFWDRTGFMQYHHGVWLAPHLWGARRALIIGAIVSFDSIWFRKSPAEAHRRRS